MSDDPSHPQLSPEIYRLICQTAAALIAADREGRIIFWSQAAGQLFGADVGEALGSPLASIVSPPLQDEFQTQLDAILADGHTQQFELLAWTVQRSRTPLLVTVAPLRDDAGETLGLVAWIVDQSKPRQLAERRAKSKRLASLGTLAGGVAHHFNNILGGVATFVDFALTSDDPTVMRRALQMTNEAVSRATKLTSGLLSFAEQDDGQGDLSDLTEVLLTFGHMSERTLAERGIELRMDVDRIPVMPVSSARMYHVLRRLLANAEEAIADGGSIDITAECVEGHVVVTISDTGCGINADILPHVTEPFVTTKGVLAGGSSDSHIGLGLSVVHGIISDMAGSLTVESEPGQGARVILSLPIPQPPAD